MSVRSCSSWPGSFRSGNGEVAQDFIVVQDVQRVSWLDTSSDRNFNGSGAFARCVRSPCRLIEDESAAMFQRGSHEGLDGLVLTTSWRDHRDEIAIGHRLQRDRLSVAEVDAVRARLKRDAGLQRECRFLAELVRAGTQERQDDRGSNPTEWPFHSITMRSRAALPDQFVARSGRWDRRFATCQVRASWGCRSTKSSCPGSMEVQRRGW